MNYEIIKISPKEHHIVEVDTRNIVSTYTRMSDAKRGLSRLLARQNKSRSQIVDQIDSAGVSVAGAAMATQATDTVAQPPTSNTGGQELGGLAQFNSPEKVSELTTHLVMVNGQMREILLRKGVSTCAHIDTLTVVMPRQVFFTSEQWESAKTEDEEDELLLQNVSEFLLEIFGFVFCVRGNGRNGYAKTAVMGVIGDTRINYGFIAWSGQDKQGDTVCLHLSGTGITAALDGWELRLYNWLVQNAPYAKITRCDLAHDFLQGEYTPIQAYFDWTNGKFDSKHTRPVADTIGLGWHNSPDKGRTLYVGSRKNGSRVVRVYEKGIEQGDKTSPWVRFELQLRNRDIIIPLDILLYPGEYLTSAYPICQELFGEHTNDLSKCERVKKQQEISVEHCIYHMSIQASPTIKMLLSMGFTSDEVIQITLNPKAKLPKRLHPNAFDVSYPYLDFIKDKKRAPYSHELMTYVSENLLQEHERQRRLQVPTSPEQLQEFRNRMSQSLYLQAALGRQGYTQSMQDWGMTLDDYYHIRFGNFNPSFNQHKEIKHDYTSKSH